MPSSLFVRPLNLNQQTDADQLLYEWALYDIAGSLLKYSARASLDMIDQTLMQNGLEQVDMIGVFPSNAALSTHVSVPGNQTRYIQQALPYAVEDQIAQDIDDMHLVLGEKNKAGEFKVVCVDRGLFGKLFSALNDESLLPSLKAIHLDSHLLPLQEHALRIILSDQQAFVSDSEGKSISVQTNNLIPYLDTVLASGENSEDEASMSLDVVLDKTAVDSSKMLLAEIQQYPKLALTVSETSVSAFEYLCSQYFELKKRPLSLCQGDFKVVSKNKGAWSRWKSVAVIAGIGFLLQLGIFIGEGVYLNQQAEQIGAQALAEYKQVVPNARNISIDKLPRIIKGQLNQLSTAGGVTKLDFLELLGEAGNQFNRSPHKSFLVFNSINYSEQRGELMLEMHAKSFDQLEALKKAIVDAGLSAKISSAVQEKDYFKGRISVSGA